jgi:hypothetical protein
MVGMAKIGLWRGLTAAALVAGALAGCAGGDIRPEATTAAVKTPLPVVRSGYACCNLHYSGNVIGDANSAQLPFIAAGTPVIVRRIEATRADLEIDGKAMQFVLEGGRSGPTAQDWVDKLVIAEDPRQRLERYPANVRNAIRAGQLMKGMTREQVTMALGHAQTDPVRPGVGSQSRYWWTSFVPFYVHWAKNGSVARVEGPAEAIAQLIYKGK